MALLVNDAGCTCSHSCAYTVVLTQLCVHNDSGPQAVQKNRYIKAIANNVTQLNAGITGAECVRTGPLSCRAVVQHHAYCYFRKVAPACLQGVSL